MRVSPTHLRASAAVALAALAATGCGDGGSGHDGAGGVRTVQVVRAAFPARQHLGQRSSFVITVRNAGDRTIPDLAVTLSGFSERTPDGTRRPLWIVDEPPPGGVTAVDDTWSGGPLAPGGRATLRWRVTAALPGTHELRYAIATRVAGGAGALLADDRPARATLVAHVAARPAFARVDPRTGRVIRE